MQSFEQSIERINAIIGSLRSGELPLDESLKLFEEGTALVAECNERLEQAQQKFSEITAAGEKE